MDEQDLHKFVNLKEDPSVGLLDTYLRIYVADKDWVPHLKKLREKIAREYSGVDGAREALYTQIAATIQMPAVLRSLNIDTETPERLLFGIRAFDQFKDKDWIDWLRKIGEKDLGIIRFQKQALNIGYIKNIEYQPNTRQAFRWLLDKAAESGDMTDANREVVMTSFRNMVWVYGGAVISNIFTRHEEHIKKVVNWRTNYFFQRVIFQVYKPEEVLKIKQKELETSNQRLVTRMQ